MINLIKNQSKTKKNHIDITSEWIKNKRPNSHKVIDRNYFKDDYGNIYRVDNKNVVLDYSDKEKEIAIWLENTFGGRIYMLPRVNSPIGIQTSDYLFRNEKWDLKEINGKSNQVLYHSIYNKSKQSKNFILDITNSELSFEIAKKQIKKIYKRTDLPFIDKIILKKNNNFLYIKENECDRTVKSARPHSLHIVYIIY